MIRIYVKLLLAGLLCVGAANSFTGQVEARGTLTTTYKYYTVSGSSAAALHANMTVPTGFFSSERVYANITMSPSFKGTFIQGKRCHIKGFGINSKFIIRLPKLSRASKLSGRLNRQFRRFVAYVRKHELTHRSIWKRCLRSAESRIVRLKIKSCNALDQAAAKIIRNEWAKCATRNTNFDRREQKRLQRLPLVKAAFKPVRRTKRLAGSSKRTRAGTKNSLRKSPQRRTFGRAND